MSDYFAHLATAARRIVGEVRPRLPLPFEAPPFASIPELDDPLVEFFDAAPHEEPPETPASGETPTARPVDIAPLPAAASMPPPAASATSPIVATVPARPVAMPSFAAGPRQLPAPAP